MINTSKEPARGGVEVLDWIWDREVPVRCLATGLNLEIGQLSRHCIAEILLNVTFNHLNPKTKNQGYMQTFSAVSKWCSLHVYM